MAKAKDNVSEQEVIDLLADVMRSDDDMKNRLKVAEMFAKRHGTFEKKQEGVTLKVMVEYIDYNKEQGEI